jgi:glycosyltransferase involved in cell wall biosynthesis
VLRRAVERWLGPAGRVVLWTFLPTPLALEMRQALQPALTVYYCVDDFASSSRAARRIAGSEQRMLGVADLVFVTSRRLRERATRLSSRVSLFPFGVDLESFERARETNGPPPASMRDLSRPVLGYVGGIHRWVDMELLGTVADRMPKATIVLVGPLQTEAAALLRRPNVRWLGLQPHDDVPQLLKHVDVGLIPYLRCPYTDHVNPTKLAEYLALGLPVVATSLPELCAVNDEHPGLLELADDQDGFVKAIERALAKAPVGEIERRLALARESAWSQKLSAMRQTIGEALAQRGE